MAIELLYGPEEWRPVVGFENLYSVSNYGRVRRDAPGSGACLIGKILQPGITRGYCRHILVKDKKRFNVAAHAMVTKAFIGPRPNKMHINHKDGNKLNNHISNLEYVTPFENVRHASKLGLMPFGDRNGSRIHPECLKRGDENGARKYPERLWRGSKNLSSKLKEKDITAIRERLKLGDKQVDIAKDYGITQGLISAIKLNKIWKHVT